MSYLSVDRVHMFRDTRYNKHKHTSHNRVHSIFKVLFLILQPLFPLSYVYIDEDNISKIQYIWSCMFKSAQKFSNCFISNILYFLEQNISHSHLNGIIIYFVITKSLFYYYFLIAAWVSKTTYSIQQMCCFPYMSTHLSMTIIIPSLLSDIWTWINCWCNWSKCQKIKNITVLSFVLIIKPWPQQNFITFWYLIMEQQFFILQA